MTSRLARSLLALAMTLALAPAVRADAPATPAAVAPTDIRAKETFAVVWERLQNSGFKGRHEGLDWAALKARHQPAIEGAQDLASLRSRIDALLKDLRASHLALIPAEAMPPPDKAVDIGMAELGLRLAIVDGRFLVERVIDGFPAARAGIRPGWQVERIDDFDAAKTLSALAQASPDAARRAASMLQLRTNDLVDQLSSGKAVNLQLRDLDGTTRTLSLTAMANPHVQAITLPGLPPMPLRFTQRTLPARNGGCVLYVEFSQWAMPVYDRFVEALREHGGCSGVVIDLRGNSGGMMATMSAVGGLFFEETVSLGTLSTGGGDLRLTAFPRQVTDDGRDVRRFQGPLAILTDRASISCSDIFPASMQALERARIFGDASAGMALPATTVPLPSGDRLYYPIADFSDPKGRRIEGVGVIPDTPSPPTAEALRAGRDRTLDAALAWIGEAGKTR